MPRWGWKSGIIGSACSKTKAYHNNMPIEQSDFSQAGKFSVPVSVMNTSPIDLGRLKTIAAPEEENARSGDAEEPAVDKEINGIEAPAVFAVVSARRILGDAVDEGSRVKAAGGIPPADMGRRGERIIAMLFGVIVRGEEGRKDHESVQDSQDGEGERELHVLHEVRQPHQLRILGSAR